MFKQLTCSCIHISYGLPSPYVYAFYMSDLMLIVHVQIKRIFPTRKQICQMTFPNFMNI